MKSYEERWHILERIGEGAQGKVFRAIDIQKFDIQDLYKEFRQSLDLSSVSIIPIEKRKNYINLFQSTLRRIIDMDNLSNHFALKVLHKIQDARDLRHAKERIKAEVQAMSEIRHPALLSLVDYDDESDAPEWYVSKYYSKGSLGRNLNLFTGNFVKSLRKIRPLVEGVAKLHKEGMVHRDIKPQNIFMDNNNNLVLGDFGIVFFKDVQRTRLSDSFKNVGSRDWMPGWAMGLKIEDVKPTFDVFSLGKLLWVMVSDMPILQLWYYNKPQFDLIKNFMDSPYIELSEKIFERCIVEDEKDCLPNASALLEKIDQAIKIIDKNAIFYKDNDIKEAETMPCNVCGLGSYQIDTDSTTSMHTMGASYLKVFTCNRCKNVKFFHVGKKHN